MTVLEIKRFCIRFTKQGKPFVDHTLEITAWLKPVDYNEDETILKCTICRNVCENVV